MPISSHGALSRTNSAFKQPAPDNPSLLASTIAPFPQDFNSWPAPTASQLHRIVTALSGGAL